MLDFLQTYSGVIFSAAFLLLMLRMHAGHRGHAGHEPDRGGNMPEPARVPVEDKMGQPAAQPHGRHAGGCH